MSSEENSLQSSLTDMMTSLMVIFILLLVNYLRNEQVAAAKAAEIPRQARADIKKELELKLYGEGFEGVIIKEDPNDPYQLIVVIPDSLLFETGQSELSPKAHAFLGEFTPRFGAVICSEQFIDKLQSFVIEGYTDNDPIRGQPLGNMQLSQNRSFAVLTKLLDGAPETSLCFRMLSSASGRGEEGCLASVTAPPEEKARCRRVDFRIRVKSEQAIEVAQAAAKDGAAVDLNPDQDKPVINGSFAP